LRYLLLLELLFKPPTIMLIDLLACWNGLLGCLSLAGEEVTLITAIFRLLVVTSSVVTAIVVPSSTWIVAVVVVVAL
jgi:hypothetical protein